MDRMLVCSLLFCLVHAQDNGTAPVFKYIDNNETVEDCKDCLLKCCPAKQIILESYGSSSCVENVYNLTEVGDFQVDIYNENVAQKIIKTNKTLKSVKFVYGDVFWGNDSDFIRSDSFFRLYLLENGSLAMRVFNYLNQWPYPAYTFKYHCLDVQASEASATTLDPGSVRLVHRVRDDGNWYDPEEDEYNMELIKMKVVASTMSISSVFLLLILVTYIVLPQKRNLPGLMMMAFVSCLLICFLFRLIQVFSVNQVEKGWCTFIGLVLYYTFYCSFTWMNVMSYDVWSNACTMFQPLWRSRSKILAKFAWYGVYGFGVPLLMTAFMVVIDFVDLSSTPDFIQPHFVAGTYCYFQNDDELRLYINVPILIATIINILFFIMTACYIWRNSAKPGGCGDSRNTKKDQNRFAIYVKLALITGVTWILEVLGPFIDHRHWVWLAADVYSSSIDLFIFYSFVCKKEVFLQLCKRFGIENNLTRQWEPTAVTSVFVTKRQLSDQESGPNENKPKLFA